MSPIGKALSLLRSMNCGGHAGQRTPKGRHGRTISNLDFVLFGIFLFLQTSILWAAPELHVLTPQAAPGETIAVSYTGFTPSESSAWIGLYRDKQAPGKDYLHYTFLNNLNDNVYDLAAPDDPGTYHVRLFADKGYQAIAVSGDIAVTGNDGGAEPQVPAAGERTKSVRSIDHRAEITAAMDRARAEVKALGTGDARQQEVERINLRFKDSTPAWVAGITRFAGMPAAERSRHFGMLTASRATVNTVQLPAQRFLLPKVIDWREKRGVTPVKDQGSCGSCWAFTTVAALESQALINHRKEFDLSEQHVVSCNNAGHDCGGGLYHGAFNLFKKHGAVLENCFPYVTSNATCKQGCVPVMRGRFSFSLTGLKMKTLVKSLLWTVGPLATSLYATDDFLFYKGGVFEGKAPRPGHNHAVLLVGYSEELDAWLIKNSWGPGWGMEGYAWVKYGSININTLIGVVSNTRLERYGYTLAP